MEKYEFTVSLKFAAQMARSGKWNLARGAIRHVIDAGEAPDDHASALAQILVILDTEDLDPARRTNVATQLHEIADDVGGPSTLEQRLI